jgi:hypothetical protein
LSPSVPLPFEIADRTKFSLLWLPRYILKEPWSISAHPGRQKSAFGSREVVTGWSKNSSIRLQVKNSSRCSCLTVRHQAYAGSSKSINGCVSLSSEVIWRSSYSGGLLFPQLDDSGIWWYYRLVRWWLDWLLYAVSGLG